MDKQTVAFSHDSRKIAFGSRPDYTLKMRSTDTGLPVHAINSTGTNAIFHALAFSVDEKLMASADSKSIQIWDISSGRLFQTIEVTDHKTKSLAFSNDGKMLASGYEALDRDDYERSVKLRNEDEKRTVPESSNDFQHQGTSASELDVDTVRIWDIDTGAFISTCKEIMRENDRIEALAFFPDDKLLASSSWNGKLKIWGIGSCSLVYSDDGPKKLDLNHQPRLWFSESGTTLKTKKDSYEICKGGISGPISFTKAECRLEAQWNKEWLQYKQHSSILWLPTEYRSSHSVVCDDLVALGHDSGGVSFIRFKNVPGDEFEGLWRFIFLQVLSAS